MTRTGEWQSHQQDGQTYYSTADDASQLTYTVELPPGDWAVYAIHWNNDRHFFTHTKTRYTIAADGEQQIYFNNMSRQYEA